MDRASCSTRLEFHLFDLWQHAERRAAPRTLSPGELRLHRQRRAARARLGRRHLCLAARQRVFEQAQKVGALPVGFDSEAFLAGTGPDHPAPEVAEARQHVDLVVLNPRPLPSRDTMGRCFWVGSRLARLQSDERASIVRLLDPMIAETERIVDSATRSTHALTYPDGAPVWAFWGVLYPDGAPLRGLGGLWFNYPDASVAYFRDGERWFYPNRCPAHLGHGRWYDPRGTSWNLIDLVDKICLNAGVLGPAIELGLGRLGRVDFEAFCLAVVECAWTFLRK